MSKIHKICNNIERNDPAIRTIYLSYRAGHQPAGVIQLSFTDLTEDQNKCDVIEFNDDTMWRHIGRAVGNNATLSNFMFFGGHGGEVTHETARCIEAFYEGLMQSKSIRDLYLCFLPGAPIFDLEYFARNNKKFKSLTLITFGNIQLAQSETIVRMLERTRLDNLDLSSYDGGNDGLLDRIISICHRVKRLNVACKTDTEYAALALLVRDKSTILNKLELQGTSPYKISQVIDGLAGNKKMTDLLLQVDCDRELMDRISRLLCNTSSIESIINSNHTLKKVKIKSYPLPEMVIDCLKLNKNKEKQDVIRQKIIMYYFKGEFEVAPFACMNISLLPKVMSIVGEDSKDQQSAIFRLLKTIPSLCNRGSRKDEEDVLGDELLMHSGRKRQKIELDGMTFFETMM